MNTTPEINFMKKKLLHFTNHTFYLLFLFQMTNIMTVSYIRSFNSRLNYEFPECLFSL